MKNFFIKKIIAKTLIILFLLSGLPFQVFNIINTNQNENIKIVSILENKTSEAIFINDLTDNVIDRLKSEMTGMLSSLATMPLNMVEHSFRSIALLMDSLSLLVLGISAILFDQAMSFSIMEMKNFLDQGQGSERGGLEEIWKQIMNYVSLLLIGILIYTAIATILQLSNVNTKKILINIIVIALFVNFSMFFTKVIIDGTNLAAIGLYQKTQNIEECNIDDPFLNFLGDSMCIPYIFLEKLKMTTVLDSGGVTLGLFGFIGAEQENDFNVAAENLADASKVLIKSIVLATLVWIISVIFIVGGILFIIRTVVLLVLIIFSPIAFAAMALPKTRSMISDRWWNSLISNSLFAPLFMFMIWVSIAIITTGNLFNTNIEWGWNDVINILQADSISPIANSLFEPFFNYIFILILLIISLILPKTLGAYGASVIVDRGKKVANSPMKVGAMGAGFALRGTVGKAGLMAENYVRNRSKTDPGFRHSRLGTFLNETGSKVSSKKFMGVKSAKDEQKRVLNREGDIIKAETERKTDLYIGNKESKEKELKEYNIETATDKTQFESEINNLTQSLENHDQETERNKAPLEGEINNLTQELENLKSSKIITPDKDNKIKKVENKIKEAENKLKEFVEKRKKDKEPLQESLDIKIKEKNNYLNKRNTEKRYIEIELENISRSIPKKSKIEKEVIEYRAKRHRRGDIKDILRDEKIFTSSKESDEEKLINLIQKTQKKDDE